jgi:histidinol phosphatase-like PHP family hydrolase
MGIVNLHIHSTFSERSAVSEHIMQIAIQLGLNSIVITDHFATMKLFSITTIFDYKKKKVMVWNTTV